MKEVLIKGLKYLLIYLILIVVFLISLMLTSLIPSSIMHDNVKATAETLNEQTNQYFLKIRYVPVKFDNYTDALMINTAYSIDNINPFYSAMVARKNYIPGKTKIITEDTSGELNSSSKYDKLDQVGDLNDTVNGEVEESFEYARYWHGYLVWLRPLLCLTNINNIRFILIIIFILLGIALIVLVSIKTKIVYGVIVRSSVCCV